MTNSAGQGWTRTYEQARNLIAAVSNSWDGTAVSSFAYENDALGRRTLRLDAAPALSTTNVFAYNQRSEVTNAAMGESTYSYDYDDIGNRRWAAADSSLSTYAANNLNQYTVVTNAGISLPVGYDLDGNMTVNGDWLYDWDGENNLWLAQQAVLTNGALQVENGYDYLKRRWYKRVDVLTGYEPPSGSPPMPGEPGEFVPSKTTCYVWVGWNIAAEINIDEVVGTTNITRYVWGLDLSGSVQGAGGVGGLLAVIEDNGSVYFPCYDANGNITEYIDATGTVRAHREFDAFGNTTAKSGDLVDSFRFWFSTKYLDAETGNFVYQQRQDIPSLGRWANRDPIGEAGGNNLFLYVGNNSICDVDYLGQFVIADDVAYLAAAYAALAAAAVYLASPELRENCACACDTAFSATKDAYEKAQGAIRSAVTHLGYLGGGGGHGSKDPNERWRNWLHWLKEVRTRIKEALKKAERCSPKGQEEVLKEVEKLEEQLQKFEKMPRGGE